MKKEETHILLHTLGLCDLRWNEAEKIENPYRNNFYTSTATNDYKIILNLIELGLMEQLNAPYEKDSFYFRATEKGIKHAKEIATANLPKLSRSKKRYDLYLQSESSETFFEWIQNEYWNDLRKRFGV